MSAENTPVLAGALPAFELFVDSWMTMVKDVDLIKENVVQFIKPGLTIAKKYYNRFGDINAYIISMCMCSVSNQLSTCYINTRFTRHQPIHSIRMDQKELGI